MKIVQISRDGTMDDIKVKMNCKSFLTLLNKKSKTQGNNLIKELYTWTYENDKIKCYGWYDGECGFENKHKLVPSGSSLFLDGDSSSQILYGDIFICRLRDKKVIDFDVSDYGEFYTNAIGEFNNTDDEEYMICSSDEAVSTDEEIIEENNYDIENNYEIINSDEHQLELDTNQY